MRTYYDLLVQWHVHLLDFFPESQWRAFHQHRVDRACLCWTTSLCLKRSVHPMWKLQGPKLQRKWCKSRKRIKANTFTDADIDGCRGPWISRWQPLWIGRPRGVQRTATSMYQPHRTAWTTVSICIYFNFLNFFMSETTHPLFSQHAASFEPISAQQCWKPPTHGRETENSVMSCSKHNPRKFGFSEMFLDYAVIIVVAIGADGSGESSDWSQRSASWKSSSDLKNCESSGHGFPTSTRPWQRPWQRPVASFFVSFLVSCGSLSSVADKPLASPQRFTQLVATWSALSSLMCLLKSCRSSTSNPGLCCWFSWMFLRPNMVIIWLSYGYNML